VFSVRWNLLCGFVPSALANIESGGFSYVLASREVCIFRVKVSVAVCRSRPRDEGDAVTDICSPRHLPH
jgi:hypothetical protein